MGRQFATRKLHAGLLLCVCCWSATTAWAVDEPVQNNNGPTSPSVAREPIHLPIGGPAIRPTPKPKIPLVPIPSLDKDTDTRPPVRALPPVPRNNEAIWGEKIWISWWETNRDAVLTPILRRRTKTEGTAKPDTPPQRKHAVEVLLHATHAERPVLRAASAVSLGQMREPTSLPRLLELATSDEEWYVRGMAWVGIGLTGAEKAESALLSAKPQTEFEHLGVLAGLGLLDHPGEKVFASLRTTLASQSSPEVRRMTLWALRAHHRPADHDLILSTLTQPGAPHPAISEALLALGALNNPADADLLINIATAGRPPDTVAQTVINSGGAALQKNRATYLYPSPSDPNQSTKLVYRGATLDNAITSQSAYIRTSAALALGIAGESQQTIASASVVAQNALIGNFIIYLDQGGPIWSGASIMSFAASMSAQNAYILRDILDMSPDPMIGMVSPKSTLRGYAALGLGIYMARGGTSKIATRPEGVQFVGYSRDLPAVADLNEVLAQRYTNQQESQELRAACALALGLSGDPANVRRLLQGAEKIDRGNELLLGYTTLALGLLGDRSALNAAGPFLSAGTSRLDVDTIAARGLTPTSQTGQAMNTLLGRRAALLGVALLADPERSEPILAGAWSRDPSTIQDVGRALAWCRAYKTADPLSSLVERDQKGAIEAAITLGWLFDTDRPSRLSRLVIGNNYHQPQSDYTERPNGSDQMIRNFHRIGDFFLYSGPVGGKPIGPATRPSP